MFANHEIWLRTYEYGAVVAFLLLPGVWGENKERFPASGAAFFAWALGTIFWFLLITALLLRLLIRFMSLITSNYMFWATGSFTHVPDLTAFGLNTTAPVPYPPIPSLVLLEGDVQPSGA